ncbi:MAG: helicase-related protein [Proteobacteria bacterium]|nr:helicase-related protein [Pseudomonadota bacterium]
MLAKTKQVFICSGSTLSLPSIQRILTEHECSSLIAQNINDIKNGYVGVCHYFIEKSFAIDTQHFFSEEAIFGKIVVSAKKKRDISAKKQLISANSYGVGDLVVHKKYGVAKFDGLLLVKSQNKEYDTVKLIYAGGDVLYVPVVNVDYVTKYGNVPEGIAIENLLDKLSGTSFATRKAKVKKNLFEIADALLKEAAKRKMVEASVFYENELTKKFDDKFLFILTDDQTLAIEDCREDLSSGRPMERLICGDVGFGKTEVAMRCCALVVFGRMVGMQYGQVCIICPTTLLAMQHYKTFQQRFEGFNVRIAKITRTTTPKERRQIIEQIKNGEVDILIATHAGFSDEISFKNLELLIIDEEQHFGVEQKEKMKKKFACHVLLLSATPIPRTLQMGLSGLKDISIIATPPFDRLLPQTQVMVFDSIVISNAIIREKQRGGRTFFVCPRVSDLEEQKLRILAITGGEVSVGIAHGGMPPAELEVVMDKFYTGVYDVLVTTSIVESGIDISFANTMVLYRAEMFGLAALYQLRGRVGRGKVQSYVYFVVKDINRMTENAKQRLKAISSINSLGEGMKIAISDLDIRGAGNVVGKEQSGKMNDVGVELYEQMLKEAVMEVKHEVREDDADIEVKIAIPFFIPEEYIPDFSVRMQVYRELSNIASIDDLMLIQDDIIDRFGKLPQTVLNLIEIIKIKIRAKTQCITRLEAGIKGVVLEFSSQFTKNDQLLNVITKHPDKFQIKTASSLVCVKSGDDLLKKAQEIMKWAEGL